MTNIIDFEKKRFNTVGLSSSLLPHYVNAVLVGSDADFWTELLQSGNRQSDALSFNIQKISSPLLFSGFQSEIVKENQSVFQNMGFSPMIGAGNGERSSEKAVFVPGSAISVLFLTGDLSIEATGTVTAVNQQQLLAFGHSLFNLGAIELPLAGAQIYATLPSLMGSSKMGAATTIAGTFLQDRISGALGDLSRMPKMIPVSLTIDSPFHDPRNYSFSLANDPAFNHLLPFFLRTALIQAMQMARLAGEQNSSLLQGEIALNDGRSIKLNDLFTSRQSLGFLNPGADVVDAADLVTQLLGTLKVHDFVGPDIKAIALKLKTLPGERYARIESATVDKSSVYNGESITVTVTLHDQKDQIITLQKKIDVPKGMDGSRFQLIVASGASLSNYEMQVNRNKFVPQDFDHLFQLLSDRRSTQNVYIQLRKIDNGLMVNGQELNSIPPSIYNVLNSRTSRGITTPLRDCALLEEVIPQEQVILGSQRLTLLIKPSNRARIQSLNK